VIVWDLAHNELEEILDAAIEVLWLSESLQGLPAEGNDRFVMPWYDIGGTLRELFITRDPGPWVHLAQDNGATILYFRKKV